MPMLPGAERAGGASHRIAGADTIAVAARTLAAEVPGLTRGIVHLGPGATIGALLQLITLGTGRHRPAHAVTSIDCRRRHAQGRHCGRRQRHRNRSDVAPLTTYRAATAHAELVGTGRQAGAGERLRRAVEDDAPGTGQRTLQFIAVGPAGRAPGAAGAAAPCTWATRLPDRYR
ncbi:hypothetical protein G6F46_013658 [Rhizopus delemar]|nr:hypothetical protein G6F46_013658 [Rhizopus delemar]